MPAQRTRTTSAPRTAAAAALVAALLTALLTAAAPAASAEGGFVSAINAARASAGLPAYATSGELSAVATAWAQHMAATGTLAHNPSLRTQVSGWRYVGENVGVGPTAGDIIDAFMASAPHRANILDTDYTQVGVGTAQGGGRLWVAEVFRQPRTAATAPKAAGAPATTAPRTSAPRTTAPQRSGTPAARRTASGTARTRTTTRTTASADGGAPLAAAAPAPVPPTPQELLRARAVAAAAGPGAAPAATPVEQALRFAAVLRAAHG